MNLAAQALQMASAFALMPFLIRSFGLADYGVFLLAGSLSGYLGLLDLGVGSSLVRYVAHFRARGEKEKLSETISTALVFYMFIGVLAASVLAVFAIFGVSLFKLDAQGETLARELFLVSSVAAIFAWPLSTANYVLGGLQRYDLAALLSVFVTVANTTAAIFVLATRHGPVALLMCVSLVSISAGVASLAFVRHQLPGVRISLGLANRSCFSRIIGFSAAVFVVQVCDVLIYQQTDRLILGVFAGAAAVAFYEAASKIHALVKQIASLSSSAVVPAASELEAQERFDSLKLLFLRGTKYTVMLVTPIALEAILLARPLLREWLGPRFSPHASSAQVFVSYWLLSANTMLAGAVLVGIGRVRFIVAMTVLGTLLNLVLSLILVQKLSVLGVILGTTISHVALFPWYLRLILKLLSVSPREWLKQVVLPTYPLLVIPLTLSILALNLGMGGSLAGLASTAVLSLGAYWLSITFIGLDKEERADIYNLIEGYLPGR